MNEYFTDELKARIESDYRAASGRLFPFERKIAAAMTGLSEIEALCLKFCLTNMPIQDLLSVPFEIVLRVIRHTLALLENDPLIETIPAEIFLSYLLFYRVNNENIEFNREFFYQALKGRIAGKTKKEIILEVNYWCGENVVYQATDERTASPLTTYRRGFGRCGEESTFLVSALRSVGIPARQIYTPRWAHCDDNHAWVEAYADGEWFYLGACEPEPRLDKGWFTASASKAILIQAKSFGTRFASETVSSATEISSLVNRTAKYAQTRRLTVQVRSDGEPLSDVSVHFEIINYAELFPILTVRTDSNGFASAEFGLGTIHLSALIPDSDGTPLKAGFAAVDLTKDRTVELEMVPICRLRNCEIVQRPPLESQAFLNRTEALVPDHADRIKRASAALAAREAALTASPRLSAFRSSADYQDRFEPFLSGARGNFEEIVNFIEISGFSADEKYDVLSTLRVKDLVDIRSETLCDALRSAKPYRYMYADEIYRSSLLAPRVANETLVTQRERIAAFYRAQGISFLSVKALYEDWIDRIRIDERGGYGDLAADAIDVLRMKIADRRSADIAFVTVARSLGFAADLDPVSGVPRGFYDGAFHPLRAADGAEDNAFETEVTLDCISRRGLTYWENVTIQRFEKDRFQTLNFSDLKEAREARIGLSRGVYRIVTAARQIDGSVKAALTFLTVAADSDKRIKVAIPVADDMTTLFRYAPLPTTLLEAPGGATLAVPASEPAGEVLAFIEIGAEPTEHFFNELLEAADEIRELNLPIRLISGAAQDRTQRTFQRVLAELPSVGSFTCAEEVSFESALHRLMNAGDERRPFILAVNSKGEGLYAFSNYNVGTVKLVMEILKAEQKKSQSKKEKYDDDK